MFIRAANPIWSFVDLTGLELNDEYYMFFLTNTLPYLTQPVFKDPDGITPWADPLQFLANGTMPENLYFNPGLVYRLEIRQGNSTSDLLIYQVENFIPGTGTSNEETAIFSAQNMISNPQFSVVNFISPYTYVQTVPGTYQLDIAPGWFITFVGAGTTVLTQIPLSGVDNMNVSGNPPYALDINSTNWETVTLTQRFEGNGAIFSNGAIAMSATMRAYVSNQPVSFLYQPSSAPSILLDTFFVTVGTFNVYQVAQITGFINNADEGNSAYVDISLALPGTGQIDITNVQFIGQSVPLPDSFDVVEDIPLFQEQTNERTIDQLFSYYLNPLLDKPIPSYLVGWDFPLNPAQFNGSSVAAVNTGANGSFYAWDQTIVFQSVTSSAVISRGAAGEFVITPASNGQFAIIQYLNQIQARKILNNDIAVNVSALTNQVGGVKATVSLWYTKAGSLPNVAPGTYDSLVLTLDANGHPATFNGTWIEVPLVNLPAATFTIGVSANTNFNDYPFTGWSLAGNADADLATFFAIVVGTGTVNAIQTLNINSVGMCPGDVATIPAPQTFDQVLHECQHFYEKSYDTTAKPGTIELNSQIIFDQTYNYLSTNFYGYAAPFGAVFNTIKRAIPVVTLYSPNLLNTPNSVHATMYANGADNADGDVTLSTYWTPLASGTKGFSYKPISAANIVTSTALASTVPASCIIAFHFTADARLGIV